MAAAGSKYAFTRDEERRMERIQKMLVGVKHPNILKRVVPHGYNDEENEYGWKKWREAVAADQSLGFSLSLVTTLDLFSSTSEVVLWIKELDQFENRWFPRTRNAIRRFVPRDRREAFEEAFFQDMAQQPEGPLVVGSVEKFLARLEDLKTSKEPGAKEVYNSLEQKGLTAELQQTMNGLIKKIQRLPPLPQTKLTDKEIEENQRLRREAYEDLNLWYIDWATVFRDVLDYNQLLKLGLVTRRRQKEDADPDED